MLQRASTSAATIYRQLPTWAKVTTVIVGALTLLYVWQILLGLFVIAAFCVGVYTLIKFFVTTQ